MKPNIIIAADKQTRPCTAVHCRLLAAHHHNRLIHISESAPARVLRKSDRLYIRGCAFEMHFIFHLTCIILGSFNRLRFVCYKLLICLQIAFLCFNAVYHTHDARTIRCQCIFDMQFFARVRIIF